MSCGPASRDVRPRFPDNSARRHRWAVLGRCTASPLPREHARESGAVQGRSPLREEAPPALLGQEQSKRCDGTPRAWSPGGLRPAHRPGTLALPRCSRCTTLPGGCRTTPANALHWQECNPCRRDPVIRTLHSVHLRLRIQKGVLRTEGPSRACCAGQGVSWWAHTNERRAGTTRCPDNARECCPGRSGCGCLLSGELCLLAL